MTGVFIEKKKNDNEYLAHFGVKGMKWKKRRSGITDYASAERHEDKTKEYLSKGRYGLTKKANTISSTKGKAVASKQPVPKKLNFRSPKEIVELRAWLKKEKKKLK